MFDLCCVLCVIFYRSFRIVFDICLFVCCVLCVIFDRSFRMVFDLYLFVVFSVLFLPFFPNSV